MSVQVRPVTAAELTDVLPLVAGYQRFYGVAEPDDDRNRRYFGRFLAPSVHGLLLGAWEAEQAVGFACLYFTGSSIHAADIVYLSDLFVAKDARGRGTGRALMEAAVEVARGRGARHIEWLTAIDNRPAQALYERLGTERDAWFGYEIPLHP